MEDNFYLELYFQNTNTKTKEVERKDVGILDELKKVSLIQK